MKCLAATAVVFCYSLSLPISAINPLGKPIGALERLHVAQPRVARKLYPRDDSASVPAFATFKRRLLGAAERGDVTVLKELMAAKIQIGFETSSSPDEAVKELELKQGTAWNELRDALKLGAVREPIDGEDAFIAPYVSADGNDLEPEDIVITGRNVSVREAPRPDARRIDVLSYDVVSRGPNWTGTGAWEQIVTPSGKVGFVHTSFVGSSTGWRFYFQRIGGQWKLALISFGD